ncbi:unnamed protein product [Trichogramma brassicae]|uniref:Uncharacterized protein n=1 Tax=Trichogramma brassicae TaxID=86971 RepID=A0A6H5I9K7_9HYME|nr:unnamed protein product [Trichogramma brassicae]
MVARFLQIFSSEPCATTAEQTLRTNYIHSTFPLSRCSFIYARLENDSDNSIELRSVRAATAAASVVCTFNAPHARRFTFHDRLSALARAYSSCAMGRSPIVNYIRARESIAIAKLLCARSVRVNIALTVYQHCVLNPSVYAARKIAATRLVHATPSRRSVKKKKKKQKTQKLARKLASRFFSSLTVWRRLFLLSIEEAWNNLNIFARVRSLRDVSCSVVQVKVCVPSVLRQAHLL